IGEVPQFPDNVPELVAVLLAPDAPPIVRIDETILGGALLPDSRDRVTNIVDVKTLGEMISSILQPVLSVTVSPRALRAMNSSQMSWTRLTLIVGHPCCHRRNQARPRPTS